MYTAIGRIITYFYENIYNPNTIIAFIGLYIDLRLFQLRMNFNL